MKVSFGQDAVGAGGESNPIKYGGLLKRQYLCWECREAIIEKFGERAYFMPSQHCHHPEPEKKPKEKCWCEISSNDRRIQWYDVVIGKWETVLPILCPICGEKIP